MRQEKPSPDPPAAAVFANAPTRLPSPRAYLLHKPAFILFLAWFVVLWVSLLLGLSFTDNASWPEGLFWLLAAITSALGLARRLPEQNVFAATAMIAGISLIITAVSQKTGIPFGPRVYTKGVADKLAGIPWSAALIWIVVMINSRGVARLIMRPWRKTTYYGFWVLGLACLLSLLLDFGFEPFASRVRHYWIWRTHKVVLNWYSAPWVNFLGWFATAAGTLAFATPWLINKQPVKQPTDYHPLILWLLLNLYFATGNATEHLWLAVGFSAVCSSLAAFYAVRGARW